MSLKNPRVVKSLVFLLLAILVALPLLSVPVHGYDDYEEYWVDSQNPEVQRMIREAGVFPLEDYLITNLKRLYWALSFRFSYDYTFENAWQTIPEMLRQNKGVCDNFARLYYSLLRGIGWPAHRIRIVKGPVYNLQNNYIGLWHAWVEIKTPSPYGTSLATFASQAVENMEGAQVTMGFNDTVLTLPEITQERIQEVKALGWGTRDGWIPVDPTVGVCASEIPLIGGPFVIALPSLFLSFGYNMFYLNGWRIHMDEIFPHYPDADRENPTWDTLSVTLEAQESFNVTYLHSIELNQIMYNLTSSVDSTLPIEFELRDPRMQVIDATSGVTSYSFNLLIPNWSPEFPKGLGIYWFTVHNPHSEPLSLTFARFDVNYATRFRALAEAEEELDKILYDQYDLTDNMWSSDSFGNPKDVFMPSETVYVTVPATGHMVTLYVVADQTTWNNGDPLTDVSDGVEILTLSLGPGTQTIQIWAPPLVVGNYDIIMDVNNNGVFDAGADLVDSVFITGFNVIPEVPFGTAMTFLSMFVALMGFFGLKRFRPKIRSR